MREKRRSLYINHVSDNASLRSFLLAVSVIQWLSHRAGFRWWGEAAGPSRGCCAAGSTSRDLGYWVSGMALSVWRQCHTHSHGVAGNWYLGQRAAHICLIFKAIARTLQTLNHICMQVCFGTEPQHLIFTHKFWSAWPVLMQCKCVVTCGACWVWRARFNMLVYLGHFSVLFCLNLILSEAESKSSAARFMCKTSWCCLYHWSTWNQCC